MEIKESDRKDLEALYLRLELLTRDLKDIQSKWTAVKEQIAAMEKKIGKGKKLKVFWDNYKLLKVEIEGGE